MPKTANQKLKLLYLMKIFSEQTDQDHTITTSDMIEKLDRYGISTERKSLYDDIECLRLFGMDIELEKNRGYYLAQRDFELPELKLLVEAVQSSKFITKKKSLELINKIEKLTSSHESKKLQRQVYVTNRIKTMNESIYYTVDYIHSAISDNVKINFRYFDWNQEKRRILRHNGQIYTVSPWALVWNNENYYLVGYDSYEEKIKHYRVDKMTDLCLSSEKRDGGKLFGNFDVASYSAKMFSMFDGDEQIVTLSCVNSAANIIIDRFGHDITFFKESDERFSVNVKVAVSSYFITWLMNFSDKIKIISPANVIEQYKALAHSALDLYD